MALIPLLAMLLAADEFDPEALAKDKKCAALSGATFELQKPKPTEPFWRKNIAFTPYGDVTLFDTDNSVSARYTCANGKVVVQAAVGPKTFNGSFDGKVTLTLDGRTYKKSP